VQQVTKGKRLRKNKTVMTVAEILESETIKEQVQRNRVYGKRLGIQEKASSIFINGLSMPKSEVCGMRYVLVSPADVLLAMVECNEPKPHGRCSDPPKSCM